MAEEFPAGGGGAAAHSLHAAGHSRGSRSRHLRTVPCGADGGGRSLAVDSSPTRPAAHRRPRTFVALGGAATLGGPAGNPGAAAGRTTGAGGTARGALCAGHLATSPRQEGVGRVDALGRAGAGSGRAPGDQTVALDAADHLPGAKLRVGLRKASLVYLALGNRSVSSHAEERLQD